ncbi:outer membrane autotransporter barrel domain-containing protein [Bartonella tamiae Th307]|uniref:Outer membrane autotransporter barrel domain-containing protein n=1 Tax=Bartonella tamiae Th239 TaxID=1094558 RepID=J0QTI2_9HYPH|nr:autotransporter outer membrane beta-barrel domain-containing protein [Bartonella tamiae]EJF89216.1 outer membrane autotransporter barrel domain-containing protein [Bartonella tamiae Th239]EJF95380.1 outer membrane autotransporter barrel domain-containing protein [Bartonella tamiae Th307]
MEPHIGKLTWIGTNSDRQTTAINNENEKRGFWIKIESSAVHINSNVNKTRSNYDLDIIKTQIGFDVEVTVNNAGKLIGVASVQYGHAKADVFSPYDHGSIKTDGYGLAGTLTWYGANEFILIVWRRLCGMIQLLN